MVRLSFRGDTTVFRGTRVLQQCVRTGGVVQYAKAGLPLHIDASYGLNFLLPILFFLYFSAREISPCMVLIFGMSDGTMCGTVRV